MAKRREILKLDASPKLKAKLRAKADRIEATMASVARRILTAGVDDRAFCRRHGLPID